MRTILFYANVESFRGAHLKLWDYFNHVQATPGFTARVALTDASRRDAANPWHRIPETIVADWRDVPASAFFIGGKGWHELAAHPAWGPATPVINLIQHVHHADPANDRYAYLSQPAIRICVSNEVKAAIEATGQVRPPVIAIPNGIDLDLHQAPPDPTAARPTELLIAAAKRPSLGRKIADRLAERGIAVRLLEERLPREDYLRELRNARVTMFLPLDEEGFYLPALEGFAAGTLVICPDCIGNRSFCLPDVTAIVPGKYKMMWLADIAAAALAMSPDRTAGILANARAIAAEYSLERERRAFQEVLENLDSLWAEAQAGMPAVTPEVEPVAPATWRNATARLPRPRHRQARIAARHGREAKRAARKSDPPATADA